MSHPRPTALFAARLIHALAIRPGSAHTALLPPRTWRRHALALALGPLAASGLVGATALLTPPAAQAQAAPAVRDYAIPAGPLSDVLARFAAESGVPLSFDPALLSARTSPGLSGRHTVPGGFTQLLASSGYRAVALAGGGYGLQAVPAAAGPRTPAPVQLSPVSVTARLYGSRETTALEDSSASVGVVTAQDIEDGQIRTVQESFRRLGNVGDAAFLNSGFVIRGMSTEGFVPSGAPMGSFYVDGILQTRYSARFGARNLWDAEQVEVYRGPQSTLSGRAATAGAIYVKTKDPVYAKEGLVAGTLGTRGLKGTAFVLNTPVVDDEVAIRLAGSMERSHSSVSYPDYERFAGQGDMRTEISRNLRAKVLFTPEALPHTRAVLSYAFSNDRPNERLIGAGADFDLDAERGDWYAMPTYAEFRQIRVHNTGLEITHDVNDALRLTSQTGLHKGVTRRRSVDLGTPGLIDGIDGRVNDELATQELRLNYAQGRWTWVGGLFASHQRYDSTFDAIAVPYLQLGEHFNRKTTNLAAFGEATYEFVPTWRATVGARLDTLRERSRNDNSDSYPYGVPPRVYSNTSDFRETNLVPKLGLAKDLAPGHVAGVTYTEGFRTGGSYINYAAGTAQYYGPESARNYELFYKGRWLDDRLILNANLFLTKYADQQIEIRPDPNNQTYRETSNAARSRSWGFEIEPTWQATRALSLFTSIGYLNTRFNAFDHASYGDLSGEPFPEAPRWSIGSGARYLFDNGFYVSGDAKFTSGYGARFGISPQDDIDSRVIVNLQAGYRQDNWEVQVFAENLFDKRYYTFIDRDAAPVYAQLGPRRAVGATVTLRY